jgi:uncharacterized small protein (DUF1192 family)
MTHDRTYYRQCSERQLINAAMDSDNELAIVLGEALESWLYLQADIMNLEDTIADLRHEVARLQGELTALGAEC